MAYKQLKDSINETIRINGNGEITGPVLNLALTAIINTVGTGSSYMGLAEKVTTPGSPDRPVFYLATGSNSFPNFGGFTPKRDGLHLFHWNPDSKSWLCKTIVDFNEPVDFDHKVKVSVSAPLEGDGTSGDPINIPNHSYESKTDDISISGSGTASSPIKLKKVSTKGPVSGSGTASDPLVIDSYSKLESDKSLEALDDKKVDKTVYAEDLASLEEYKESQSELNVKQDIGINKNLQNINQLNDTIKLLSQKDEPIMTANGGGIISLPNNAMKSVAPNYKFEGLTINQIYNFDEWRASNVKKGVENGVNYFQATAKYGSLNKIATHQEGDVIYYDISISTKQQGVQFYIDGLTFINFNSDGNIDNKKGIIKTNKPAPISLTGGIIDAGQEKVFVHNASIINLTQTFGAGNEPTKEWCDEHISGYFEGSKSVTAPLRIKSVGENLCRIMVDGTILGKKVQRNFYKVSDTEFGFDQGGWTISFFQSRTYEPNLSIEALRRYPKLPKNKPLYIQCDSEHKRGGIEVFLYGEDGVSRKLSDYGVIVDSTGLIYIPPQTEDLRLSLNRRFDNAQDTMRELYIGFSKPSRYVPYKETITYINNQLELKSVGTVKDYIENGKLHKYISDDGEILEQPEIINLSTSGLITNHPNGTIIIEPITNVTAYYNDGLDVSKFNIESVGEFAIFKDGNYQSLDVRKIEITDNKLTHPDAINGLCYLVYRYDDKPIFGDNEVEYYNNDGILVSPDGTFWKPVLTVDDEGNVLMKGEKL